MRQELFNIEGIHPGMTPPEVLAMAGEPEEIAVVGTVWHYPGECLNTVCFDRQERQVEAVAGSRLKCGTDLVIDQDASPGRIREALGEPQEIEPGRGTFELWRWQRADVHLVVVIDAATKKIEFVQISR